jgi:hypothetical protein
MFESELGRRIVVLLAVATLCCAAAGCAVDIGTTGADKSDGNNQLRYYGGPKSPMWRGPVEN